MSDLLKKYRFDKKNSFSIKDFNPSDSGNFDSREDAVEEFVNNLTKINREQQKLYAENKEGVIFIFQAMDAAGKDGVIRTVFSTLTPHGVKEYCFKVPSKVELAHDYLWRFWSALPAKGNISIFNRSYYEDVLVGKVHKLYEDSILPERINKNKIIEDRYEQINNFEKYLYDTGTRVVKIFLNVSKDEQARRFISRIDTPKKNWKISAGDIEERQYWDDYMEAFEDMVNATSTEKSPWYVVPADHKWYTRLIVSRIVLETLKEMDPSFPEIGNAEKENIQNIRQSLIDSMSKEGQDKMAKNEEDEELGEFAQTGDITAEMIKDEELEKVKEKNIHIKNSGFKAVRDLLASGYILKSRQDIVNAIADGQEEIDGYIPSETKEEVKEEIKEEIKDEVDDIVQKINEIVGENNE